MIMACFMIIPIRAQEPAEEIPETPAETVTPAETHAETEAPADTVEPTENMGEDMADEAGMEVVADEAGEMAGEADTVKVTDRVEVIETPDNTRVTLGRNQAIIVEDDGDTVFVALGSKGVSIVENEQGETQINVIEMDKKEKRDGGEKSKKRRLKPNYAGLELGLNNYLTPDYSMVMNPGEEFMDLNTGRSWNWNLNVVDYGIGFGTDKFGLVVGLGFEFINYRFDGQNGIMKDTLSASGEIVSFEPDYAGNITKSKMNIAYVTTPLLLEWQIPARHGRFHFSAGVIGGLKMWSNTKIEYRSSGSKQKTKNRSDYNLSPLRWGVTARAGYNEISIFANYYLTPLFKPNLGPELYPFTIGLAFTPN